MPATAVATAPTLLSLAQVTSTPLTWLWPGRLPLGHLTLLDAAPGSGLSLFTLTLAACLSRGTPLPDGTPTQPIMILLLAPYDSAEDTILPRFTAAGGDPTRLVLYRPTMQETPQSTVRSRALDLSRDLEQLANTIRQLDVRLLILDPACSVTGLARCLPALLDLAHDTHCALLLTRTLRQAPADPLHTPAPSSPLLHAARSRLLLTPNPANERQQLLLTTKHTLCAAPGLLAYDICVTQAGIPTLHWLPAPDRTALDRLCTGPLRSPQRQAILRFLHACPTPQSLPAILSATSYDYVAGRKMLQRMRTAGELVSPATGLYTTAQHPCLADFPAKASPVSPVPARSERSATPLGAPPATTPPVPSVPPVSSVPTTFVPWTPAPSALHAPSTTSPSTPQPVPTVPARENLSPLISRIDEFPYDEAYCILWKACTGEDPTQEDLAAQPEADADPSGPQQLSLHEFIRNCLSHLPDAPWRFQDLT